MLQRVSIVQVAEKVFHSVSVELNGDLKQL